MTGGSNEPGSRFGPWTLDAHLGGGLLGDVWSAQDDAGEDVALKRLHPDLTEALGARFIACAEATQGLDHPRIAAVVAAREHIDGRVVVVRKLVRGESAASFASRRRGRVPPSEALRIVEGAARAIAYAHEQGMLHGALHAGHVLLGNDGSVSVVDFNFSELRQDAALEMELPGPPDPERYEAPEASFAATPESDVWSLGALLFLLLTGQHVREAGMDTARVLTEFSPDAPTQLLNLFERALALDPDTRLSPTQLAGACRLLRQDPMLASLTRIAAATVLPNAQDGERVSAPPTSTRRQSRSKIASSTSGTREAARSTDALATEAEAAETAEAAPAARTKAAEPTERAPAEMIEQWQTPPESDVTPVTGDPPLELDLSGIRDPRFGSVPADSVQRAEDLGHALTVPALATPAPTAPTAPTAPAAPTPPKRSAVTSSFPPASDDRTQTPPPAQRYSSRPPAQRNPSIELMLEVPAEPSAPQEADAIDLGEILVGDDAAAREELDRLAGILAFDSALMLEDAFADGHSQPPRRFDSRFWRRLSIAARPANAAEVETPGDLERALDVAARVLVDSAALNALDGGHSGLSELLTHAGASPEQRIDLIAQVDRESSDAKFSSKVHAGVVCAALTPETLEQLLAPATWGSVSPDRRGPLRAALHHLDEDYLPQIASSLCANLDPELGADLSRLLERLAEDREHILAEAALAADFQGALKLIRVLMQLATPSARAALEAIGAGHGLALIRIEALAGAEGLTGPRVRAELTALLDTEPSEDARVQALRAIRDFELRAAGPHLALRIKSNAFAGLSHEEKRQLLHALGVIMPPRAEAIAGEILLDTKLLESSAHEEARVLAADLLGAIASTEDSKDILEEAAKRRWGAKEAVRAAAERALAHWAERAKRKPGNP